MLIVADKQILCATCGNLIGLRFTVPRSTMFVKDHYVVSSADEDLVYCNIKCRERAQV